MLIYLVKKMEILNTWGYARIIEQFFDIEMSENSTVDDFRVQVVPFFNHIMELPADIFSKKEYDLKDIDNYNMFAGCKRLLLCLHKLMMIYGVEGCFESMFAASQICYDSFFPGPDLGG